MLPPRPQAIRIDETDPCSLLTSDQQTRLGVRGATPVPAEEKIGPGCRWLHSPDEPVEAYQIFRDTESGIESGFGNSRGITVITVAGFPAIETQSERTQLPETQCIVAVDVAPGQTLQVNYDYNGALPMTRERACDKARPAAEMAMRTLIEQAGG